MKAYVNGPIWYHYDKTFRKWLFRVGESNPNTFLTACPGGQETAHKIGNLIHAAHKRTKGAALVDGLARANISRLVSV